jgi:hypothetical protein
VFFIRQETDIDGVLGLLELLKVYHDHLAKNLQAAGYGNSREKPRWFTGGMKGQNPISAPALNQAFVQPTVAVSNATKTPG